MDPNPQGSEFFWPLPFWIRIRIWNADPDPGMELDQNLKLPGFLPFINTFVGMFFHVKFVVT